MTLSQEPDAENLDLSELERKEVLCSINTHFILLKSIVPFLYIFMGCVTVGLIPLAMIYETGYSMLCSALITFILGYFRHDWRLNVSKRQAEAVQLFDQHIGSWKFERHTNRKFGTYLFQRKRMRTWLIVGVNLIMVAGVVFLFFLAAIAPTQDFDVIISIVMLVPVFIFMLLFLIVYNALYPRYRSYSPTVHCCILTKGYIYTMGQLYPLRPEGWPSTCVVFNLSSIVLEEKMIEETTLLTVLRIEIMTRGKKQGSPLSLEVPVPERAVSDVNQWMHTLADALRCNESDTMAVKRDHGGITREDGTGEGRRRIVLV